MVGLGSSGFIPPNNKQISLLYPLVKQQKICTHKTRALRDCWSKKYHLYAKTHWLSWGLEWNLRSVVFWYFSTPRYILQFLTVVAMCLMHISKLCQTIRMQQLPTLKAQKKNPKNNFGNNIHKQKHVVVLMLCEGDQKRVWKSTGWKYGDNSVKEYTYSLGSCLLNVGTICRL